MAPQVSREEDVVGDIMYLSQEQKRGPMTDFQKVDLDYYFTMLSLDDSGDHPYHELYLQRQGTEFMTPILFEDGMDFIECELYYASIRSQYRGGDVKMISNKHKFRPTPPRDFRSCKGLPSCLRKSKYSGNDQTRISRAAGKAPRRCSFTGLPEMPDTCEPMLVRSNSHRQLIEHKPSVAFEEYVQVVTIHHVQDYPRDVRSSIWMSREEMQRSMQRAVEEDMREQRERQRKEAEKEAAAKQKKEATEKKREREVARTPSVDSIIQECFTTAQIFGAAE